LTGADDAVDVERLAQMSKAHPLIEWAILSSSERAGSNRYPTDDWVARFHKACPHVRKAIHLCGNDVFRFLEGDVALRDKVAKFDRVQMNFNHRRKPIDLERLETLAQKLEPTVILQYNSANESLWDLLRGRIPNLMFLFDASGGNGKQPDAWPAILPDTVCGYAGGLGPLNMGLELPKIAAQAGTGRFWVDMESRLRAPVNDRFDLLACEIVMRQVESYVASCPENWKQPAGDSV
jgi:hypothetical protein